MGMVGTLVGVGNISLDADLSRLWDHTRLLEHQTAVIVDVPAFDARAYDGLNTNQVRLISREMSLLKERKL